MAREIVEYRFHAYMRNVRPKFYFETDVIATDVREARKIVNGIYPAAKVIRFKQFNLTRAERRERERKRRLEG